MGRFISQDKIAGLTQAPFTLNQYAYVWNNPLNLVDLDGDFPIFPPIPGPVPEPGHELWDPFRDEWGAPAIPDGSPTSRRSDDIRFGVEVAREFGPTNAWLAGWTLANHSRDRGVYLVNNHSWNPIESRRI